MEIKTITSIHHPAILLSSTELQSYLSLLKIDITFNSQVVDHVYTLSFAVVDDLTSYGLPKVTDPLLDDQYYIDINHRGGLIAGINPRSVLLGVYAYLHQIGFRFLQPGKQFDYIPDLTQYEDLYVKHSHTPSFRHRGICLEGASSLENILDFIEWMPKAGYNSFFVQFQVPYTFLARWYEHEHNPFINKEPFHPELANHYSQQIDRHMEERNLLHHRVGHGWTCEVAGYPSFGWMEADSSKDTSLLAQLNGERQLFHGVPLNTNLCYSNPEAVKQMTDTIVSYAKQHTCIDYLHIWLADGYNNICECNECQKTTPSDQYIHILNLVDEQLTKLNLPVNIVFLIYQELLWAPVTEKFQHPQRFTLMFAPISRRFMESYPQNPELLPVPDYKRNHISLPVTVSENISFLHQWQACFKGDSFIYDYPLGRAHYGDLSYMKIAHTIHTDIKHLSSLGLHGYISCQEIRAALPNGFPNYVMGHVLTDQSVSFSSLKEDYLKHAYGDDYLLVKQYLEDLSQLYDCDYTNGKGSRINPILHENMKQALPILSQFSPVIKAHTSSKPWETYFWELLDYHNGYSLRLTKTLLFLSAGNQHDTRKNWEDFRNYICRHEIQFQPYLDVFRVTDIFEHYTGVISNNHETP